MKHLIKAILPKRLAPIAGKVYRRISHRTSLTRHSSISTENPAETPTVLRCSVSYNRYGGYCIPDSASHRPAARTVLSGGVHEPDTIAYMMANCGDRDIIHAGTFFGDFLPALSGALGRRALIWAFEPNRESFRCARITLAINDVVNVRLSHAGLGDKAQQLFVQTANASGRHLGGASRIVNARSDAQRNERVQIVPIDKVISTERDIGILQLDVEGYEKEALSGGLVTIRRCLPTLVLEVLPNSDLEQSEWFSKNVLSLGYRMIAKLHRNSVYSCEPKRSHG